MINNKCPKCGSEKTKKDGPFARKKEEGAVAYKGPSIVQCYCWECEYSWQEQV